MTTELGPFPDVAGYQRARELDAADPIAHERDRFRIADPELIYLDGNSLGMMPEAAAASVDQVVEEQWGRRLIKSWREGWWDLQLEVGDLLAPVIGAGPGEVIISDSTSVNLFKLAVAALTAQPGRSRIITDDLNFPTDIYVLNGITEMLGEQYSLDVIPSPNGIDGPVEAIEAALDDDVALLSLSAACYRSAYSYDVEALTAAAHSAGAMVLWDLSHAAGSVEVDLGGAGADLAIGCTYKYLNGGPGSPAFLYVRRDLQNRLENPITAWWGHAEPFAMELTFTPTEGIRRFHAGTMPILSLAASQAGIEQVVRVGMDAIRSKSVALTQFFVDQTVRHLVPMGFSLASPADPARRGSHVALAHPAAWQIVQAMIEDAKVLPDFREPDVVRSGLSPLTTRFIDVHTAVVRIARLVETGTHQRFQAQRAGVT